MGVHRTSPYQKNDGDQTKRDGGNTRTFRSRHKSSLYLSLTAAIDFELPHAQVKGGN